MKGRESPIALAGTYCALWTDYSQVEGRFGRFRYIQFTVAAPGLPGDDAD